jgi:inhibitor of KinA
LFKIRFILPLYYSISPLNETALLVSFENIIDEAINNKVMLLQQALAKNNFKGFVETVPAYNSLAVFYNVVSVKKNYLVTTTVFDVVKKITEKLINEINSTTVIKRAIRTIPVYYNGEDLEFVATQHNLSTKEVINIHIAKVYRVFMIGFLPGFAYMGKVDECIATPRLSLPRKNVQAGSVGIAGFQTGIYPLPSPGGWQLIGQTPIKIFDATKNNPCLLQAGDEVKFVSISKTDFEKLNEY